MRNRITTKMRLRGKWSLLSFYKIPFTTTTKGHDPYDAFIMSKNTHSYKEMINGSTFNIFTRSRNIQTTPSCCHFQHREYKSSSMLLLSSSSSSSSSTTTSNNSKVQPSINIQSILKQHIKPGSTINIGGFGLGGIPETLIHELEHCEQARDLRIASLTAGVDGFGLGRLFEKEGKVKRIIASYVGENKVSG